MEKSAGPFLKFAIPSICTEFLYRRRLWYRWIIYEIPRYVNCEMLSAERTESYSANDRSGGRSASIAWVREQCLRPLCTSPEGHKTKRLSFLREHPAIGGGALRMRATCERVCSASFRGSLRITAVAVRKEQEVVPREYFLLFCLSLNRSLSGAYCCFASSASISRIS